METRARYLGVGFFTLVVIALAFGFVYWLKRLDETGIRKTMYLMFPGTVSGLEPGGSVYFNGLKVGEVAGLQFNPADPDKIVVEASVRSDAPIKTDTRAKVGSSLLTGVAYIEMSGGTANAQSVFDATPPLIVGQTGGDIMAAINEVGAKVDQAVTRIDNFIAANEAAIHETVENVRQFSGALSKNSAGVADFLKNVSDMSSSIKSLTGRLETVVDDAEKVVAAIPADKVKSTVDNAEKVVADVAAVSKDVTANVKQAAADAAEVTAGLKKTAAKIDDAIAAFDKNKITGVVDDVSAFAGKLRAAGPEIDTIVADAKKATQSATDFANNLSKHNGDVDKIVADAKDLVARVNESSKKLDELFGKANDLLGPQGGSKNFFQEAADAAKSVKTLADSLNGHIDEIAAGIEKFSDQGLANIDALVTQLRGTALRLDQAVSGIARNPSSIVFGGNSDIREYNRR